MSIEAVGVPQLGNLVCPLPDHSTLLFRNDPGVEAEPFLYQAAHQALRDGQDVVYVLTNRTPRSLFEAMQGFGFRPDAEDAHFVLVDAYSAAMGLDTPAAHVIPAPLDLRVVADLLERLSIERPDAWLIIDSLSSLLDQADESVFIAQFPRILAAMKRFAFTEALFTRWPYGEQIESMLADFDGVIGVRGVEDRVTTGQFFVVERAPWRTEEEARAQPRLFKSLKPGGVHVFIPKIVVTGPFNAGKSSFIHAVSDTAVSADHLGTTVALDHGSATMDGLTADIFGTPGQARFDPILKIIAGQAVGVIVVVDSTKPESFPRAREMLEQTWKQGLPAIIAANKQDLPGALSAEQVAAAISPPPRVRVVSCTGQDEASARRVLKELVDQILAPPAEDAA